MGRGKTGKEGGSYDGTKLMSGMDEPSDLREASSKVNIVCGLQVRCERVGAVDEMDLTSLHQHKKVDIHSSIPRQKKLERSQAMK